ncbi:hypothetical protein TNCV_1354151 [Trichonephila clavipes]|nr:hypothetical protein TNCV_1354151 [Trichonephila clavipes]
MLVDRNFLKCVDGSVGRSVTAAHARLLSPLSFLPFVRRLHSVVSYRVLKMEVNKEKIRYILQFFFDKCENASQAAEIVNDVDGADTVTANYVQYWFRRFR